MTPNTPKEGDAVSKDLPEQSNKALRDAAVKKLSEILGWDILDKWDEELLTKAADQILALVTNHIKELPSMQMEKPSYGGDKWEWQEPEARNSLRQQIVQEMGE